MKRGKRLNNVAIGAFIFAGIILFSFFIIFAGKFSFMLGGGYKIQIEYDFLDNLQSGAKVRVSGGPSIGYIGDINFNTGKIVIDAYIDGKYKINRGADFNIYSTSLVGQKYINVSGYDPKATEFYTNNEYVVGVTPIGFARVIELAGAGIKSLTGAGNADTATKFKDVFNDTADFVKGLNHLVNDNAKDIRQSISNLNLSLKNTGEMMDRINNTLAYLESGSKQLNSTIGSVDQDQIKSIISNVNDSTVELKALSTELKNLSIDITKLTYDKTSPLGLTRDKDFRARIDNIAKNFEEFSKKIKDNPSLLFFGK